MQIMWVPKGSAVAQFCTNISYWSYEFNTENVDTDKQSFNVHPSIGLSYYTFIVHPPPPLSPFTTF